MKRHHLDGLAVASLLVMSISCAAAPRATAVGAASAAPATTQAIDEFKQMETVCKIEGDALAKFRAATAQRHQKFAAWQETDKGKKLAQLRAARDEAKKAKDDAKLTAAEAALEPLAKEEQEFRSKIRADVMALLSLDQQRAWAAYVLNGLAMKSLGKAQLTDDQKEQVLALCREPASKYVAADTIARDPYLSGLKEFSPQVVAAAREKVLTAEQREKTAPKPPATKAATTRAGK
jgi:hypothetical protein